jgi:hypothetical protein
MLFDIFEKEEGISTCIYNVVEILNSSCRNWKNFVRMCRYFFFFTDIFFVFFLKKDFFYEYTYFLRLDCMQSFKLDTLSFIDEREFF